MLSIFRTYAKVHLSLSDSASQRHSSGERELALAITDPSSRLCDTNRDESLSGKNKPLRSHTPYISTSGLYNGLVLKPPGLRCLCDDLSCLSTTLWYGVSVLYFTHAHTYVWVCVCARAPSTPLCAWRQSPASRSVVFTRPRLNSK